MPPTRSPGSPRRLLIDDGFAKRDRDGMGAGVGLELGEDVTHVALDRLLRDEEPGGDVRVRHAVRKKLEDLATASNIELKPAIEAEGREAVREIVASGAGVGFVSAAEFGHDSRLVPIAIDAPETLMDEALICLRERSGGKLVRAFLDMARSMSGD